MIRPDFPLDTNSQNSRNGPFPQILGNSIQSNMGLPGIMHRYDLIYFLGKPGSSYTAFFLISQLYILRQQFLVLLRQLNLTFKEFHWLASTSKHRDSSGIKGGLRSNLDLILNSTSPRSFGEGMVKKNEGRLLLEGFTKMSEEITFSEIFKRNLITPSHHYSVSFLRITIPFQSYFFLFLFPK